MTRLSFPDPPDIRFPGFTVEAFEVLARLRAEPHIEQYRKEKGDFQHYVMRPFRQLRDDLVLNWVLPNRLNLETERNVFSRILKNDFGAGGCHHHIWLSFYRPGRRRLTDVQLAQAIYPDRFSVSLFVGGHARDLVKAAGQQMTRQETVYLRSINDLIQCGYDFRLRTASDLVHISEPIEVLPAEVNRATHMWLRTSIPAGEAVSREGELVPYVLGSIRQLWPMYVRWTNGTNIHLHE